MARLGASAPLVVLLSRVSDASRAHLAVECSVVLRLRGQPKEPPVTYIEIPRWDDFQHYKDRDPKWIKNYTRLLDDDAYLALTGPQRAVLHGLWLAHAKTHGKTPENTAWLSRYLGLRVTKTTLASLNHAGFIVISASNLLAEPYQPASPEVEEEEEKNTEGSYAGTPGELERLGAVYDFQAILREQRGRGAA